jgi:hypothetical protein
MPSPGCTSTKHPHEISFLDTALVRNFYFSCGLRKSSKSRATVVDSFQRRALSRAATEPATSEGLLFYRPVTMCSPDPSSVAYAARGVSGLSRSSVQLAEDDKHQYQVGKEDTYVFFWGVITTLLRPARIVDWVGSPSHQIPIVFSCPADGLGAKNSSRCLLSGVSFSETAVVNGDTLFGRRSEGTSHECFILLQQ